MSIENFGFEPNGATPLTEEDYLGLKPKWIATQGDLNQAEAQNIMSASNKYFQARLGPNEILDDHFVRQLHKDMFSNVWEWAGTYRTIETSIGFDPLTIPSSVYMLMENSKHWLLAENPDSIDSTICEVHHKLVQIHPFRNGNGRMTRLFADLLLISLGRPVFSWSGGDWTAHTRQQYIDALRSADGGDMSLLLGFVRS